MVCDGGPAVWDIPPCLKVNPKRLGAWLRGGAMGSRACTGAWPSIRPVPCDINLISTKIRLAIRNPI